MYLKIFLISVLCFWCYAEANSKVVINEFLASNNEGLSDEDGDNPDWIELYNKGNEPYDLSSHYITDDNEDLGWQFPEVTIEPGEFLLVFASGKDRKEGELHTDFRISKDGEPLVLIDPTGFVIDRVDALFLPTDISYGRLPDGGEGWYFFDDPTPARSNTESEEFAGLLEPPEFSHSPGFHQNAIKLEITSANQDAEIYYTTDGSLPTSNDKKYKEPLILAELSEKPGELASINTSSRSGLEPSGNDIFHAHTIRAIAYKPGKKSSSDRSGTFFITDEGQDRYSFPVASFQLDSDSLFGEERGIFALGNDPDNRNFRNRGQDWERPAHFEFFDHDQDKYHHQNLGLRVHGGHTREFPKKSMRVYSRRQYGANPIHFPFYRDEGINEFKRLIFRQSGNDWGGPYGWWSDNDRGTLFRDALGQEILKDMKFDRQATRPSVVFINGEYWGIYNIRERFDRFYVATNYNIDREKVDQLASNMKVDEGSSDHFEKMWEYIQNNDLSEDKHYEHIQTMMDVENFIEYQIAQVFMNNDDWPHNNIRYWRKKTSEYKPDAPYGHDGRWRWMLYDLDFGLNLNKSVDYNMLEYFKDPEESAEWATFLIRNLLKNESFYHDFVRTFCDHLNTTFERRKMINILKQFTDKFAPEMEENINRWDAPETKGKWRGNVNEVRKFLFKRPGYAWNHLEDFSDHGEKNPLLLNVDNYQKGYLKINGMNLEDVNQTWKGYYFDDLELEVEALPYEGAKFQGWKGDTTTSDQKIRISVNSVSELTAVFEKDPDFQPGYSFPDLHNLAEADFYFNSWPEDAQPGTYPGNMVFHQIAEKDPAIDEKVTCDYTLPYNLESRSRMTGLGEDGFAFINTSNAQDEPGAEFMGAALLGLDTRERENIRLSWTGQTVLPNHRHYGIRVQYRSGRYGPFKNLKDEHGNIVEYVRNEQKGHNMAFEDIELPEKLADNEEVYIRFKYYYLHPDTYYDSPSGPRAKLAVNTVEVTSEEISEDVEEKQKFSIYPNPNHGDFYIESEEFLDSELKIEVLNAAGQLIKERELQTYLGINDYDVKFPDLAPGMYIVKIQNNDYSEMHRMLIR